MASAKHFYYARTCVHTRCTRVRHACTYDRRGPLISSAMPIVNNCFNAARDETPECVRTAAGRVPPTRVSITPPGSNAAV